MLPWRNTVTHDSSSFTTSTHNWILFDVEAVDIPEDQDFNDYLSMVTSFSSASDDLSGLEFHASPISIHSSSFSPRIPIFSMKKKRSFQVITHSASSVMDLFHNAKAVRLKNHHNKYLHAEEDEESVSQDRNGSSKNNRWTVEFITIDDSDNNTIRLKSCYNKYLTASNHPFLLGMTGRKVLQTSPRRLDSSVEWEPVREGNQVKLTCVLMEDFHPGGILLHMMFLSGRLHRSGSYGTLMLSISSWFNPQPQDPHRLLCLFTRPRRILLLQLLLSHLNSLLVILGNNIWEVVRLQNLLNKLGGPYITMWFLMILVKWMKMRKVFAFISREIM